MTIEVIIGERWYSAPEPTGLAASSWDMRLSEITEGRFPIASEMRRCSDYVFYRLWEVNPGFEDQLAELLRTYAPQVPWERGTPAELIVAFRKIVGYGLAAAGQDDVAWGGTREGYPS
ncbi:MAG: hypothetical protein V3U28_05955 [Candidatus Acidoferrales bacterium]